MIWVLWITLGLCVVGVKYYTAVGGRRLERRLNRVKADLGKAKQRLRDQREKESDTSHEEEVTEMRVRSMKELMDDMRVRLQSSDARPKVVDEKAKPDPVILASFTRF